MDESPDRPILPTARGDVPVFSLTIFTRKNGSTYTGRTANLAMESIVANSSRDALSKIVPLAKKLIGDRIAAGEPIPWIDPAAEKLADEQQFLVPIHL